MNVQRRLPRSHPLVTYLVTQALEHTADRDCPANGVSGLTRWPRVSGEGAATTTLDVVPKKKSEPPGGDRSQGAGPAGREKGLP
jgi:hypothetical protein